MKRIFGQQKKPILPVIEEPKLHCLHYSNWKLIRQLWLQDQFHLTMFEKRKRHGNEQK